MDRRRKDGNTTRLKQWMRLSADAVLIAALSQGTIFADDDPPWMPPSDQPEDKTPPTIPIFVITHSLQYQFPFPANPEKPGDIDETNSIGYHLEYEADVVLVRPNRETTLRFAGWHDYACRAVPISSESDSTFHLETRLMGMDMDCQAGHGSYRYRLDEDGLTIRRPATDEQHYNGSDQYYLDYSLDILNASPGSIPIHNGAIIDSITPAPLLSTLDSDWVYSLWPMLMPPLPNTPVRAGKQWSAGSPVIFSIYAKPRNMRYQIRLNSYDVETGLAEIHWSGRVDNVNIEPRPGIHHLTEDMLATIEITGDLTMNVETGHIRSSRVQLDSRLTNPNPSRPDVNFSITINIQSTDTENSGTGVSPVDGVMSAVQAKQ